MSQSSFSALVGVGRSGMVAFQSGTLQTRLFAALYEALQLALSNLKDSEATQVALRHAMHCTAFYGAACAGFVLLRPMLRVVAASLARRRHHQLVTAAAKLLRSSFILLPETAPLRPALERIAAAERTPRTAFARLFSDECVRVVPCAIRACARRYLRSLAVQLILIGLFRTIDTASCPTAVRSSLLPPRVDTARAAAAGAPSANGSVPVSDWSAVSFYDFVATVPSELSLRWPRFFSLSEFFLCGGLPLARFLPGVNVARLLPTATFTACRADGFRGLTVAQLHAWTKTWSWSTHAWWCGTHWLTEVVDDCLGAVAQLVVDARRRRRHHLLSSSKEKHKTNSGESSSLRDSTTNHHTHNVGNGHRDAATASNTLNRVLEGMDDSSSSSQREFASPVPSWNRVCNAGKRVGKSLARLTLKCTATALVAWRAQRWRWLRHVPLVGGGGEAYAAVCLCFVVLRRM